MTTMLPASQSKRRALYRNLMIVLIGLITAVAVASRVFDVHLHALASVLMLAALVVSVLQFQSIDEVAKQAHYVAWLWGSMMVIGLIGVAMAIAYAVPGSFVLPVEGILTRFFGDAEPDTAFMAGAIATPLLMVAGFTVWWALFWLRRR